MKLFGVVATAVILQLSLIFVGGQRISDWMRQTIDGPAKVREKVDLIFTPNSESAVYLLLGDLRFLLSHEAFNKSRPTVFYFHGWLESGQLDLSVIAIRGAYLDRGDHNMISVDWSYYAKDINYHLDVIPQEKIIAETFADEFKEFIYSGYNISNVHLVGHSLGGQMVGKIGRHLKKITDGKMILPRIYALDPAGPGFEDHSIDGFEPISRTDAAYVHIIHTCGGRLGMQHRVGTIDFFPDGGSRHPGCNVDVTASLIPTYRYVCDHARSWHFFQNSVRDPSSFPAIRCLSWDEFLNNGTCYKDDIVNMGFGANISATGKYFLETNGNMFNLSRGIAGTTPSKINVTRLQIPSNNFIVQPVPAKVQELVIF